MWQRYEFAGGGDGTWGDAPELVARYATTQRCAAGAIVAFAWESAVPHDLVRLPSADALERCDFTFGGLESGSRSDIAFLASSSNALRKSSL